MSTAEIRAIIIIVSLCHSMHGVSQNILKNPSFEKYAECPTTLGNFNEDVEYWTTPTIGSTDYFNACSTAMGTPENFNGEQPANFGVGYTGLYFYAPDDYREYVQAELTNTLQKDKRYRISFYVSLAENSDFAVRDFGVLFSSTKLNIPIKKELSKMHLYKQKDNAYNFLEIGYDSFYKDTDDWILVYTEFIAKGVENYMTIGNFKSNRQTRKFKTKRNANQGAYYYMDMVTLRLADQNSSVKEVYELDKTHLFENVLFQFDKYQLLESSKNDLRKIFDFLTADNSLFITIHGHTDNVGLESYNKILSEERCSAVTDYFLKLGLPEHRISWQAFGGSKPVADNTTEAGRQLNRRVEFTISKEQIK